MNRFLYLCSFILRLVLITKGELLEYLGLLLFLGETLSLFAILRLHLLVLPGPGLLGDGLLLRSFCRGRRALKINAADVTDCGECARESGGVHAALLLCACDGPRRLTLVDLSFQLTLKILDIVILAELVFYSPIMELELVLALASSELLRHLICNVIVS